MFKVELELIKDWLKDLDKDSATQVYAALRLLQQYGPQLRRPIVGKIEGSHIQNLKELRPGSSGRSEVRILFVFDPSRQAVMLVGGDKQNKWNKWYRKAIDEAEARYEKWLSDHSE
ncbi:type II toxin-antitoxin system RelE/ParE family toxin [Bifidobacterium callitrichidarum]|uniref:Addiction module toxin RelE n=1 Tax=Bifidobacterium callitrichidarum TaxID=2052941 RepID=A0A2U2N938_9BIFI|nr:type II toxin-antitoxin system RelE/ParE family toxin [Bifidobacterium callitrichidarum]PWG65676.1 addiction module toxin RelE [Bifidobacterium callitrichidarum]